MSIAFHCSTVPSNVILMREGQADNMLSPKLFTELGIVMLSREEQPENVRLAILVTESGIYMLLRFLKS